MNGEKLQDLTNMNNAFNNFFITVTEKLNFQQIQKGDAISFQEDKFPGKLISIIIIPIIEAEIKSTIEFLQRNNIISL